MSSLIELTRSHLEPAVAAVAIVLLFAGGRSASARAAAFGAQTTAPASVTDVASCELYLASLGSDSANAQTGCQAMQTLSQTVNEPFGTVFGCAWTQATAVRNGAQIDAAALLSCLGVGQ